MTSLSAARGVACVERSAVADLAAFLDVLAGDRPGGRLLELRYRAGAGMRQLFVPARRPDRAVGAVLSLASQTDVYVGVLLRSRRAGDVGAVVESHLAFVEIDRVDAAERLAAFPHEPTMVVASGSPGHLHVYFGLSQPAAPAELVEVNRTLARRLGGDESSIDAPRVLRPPSSRNWKHSPPAAVSLVSLDTTRRVSVADLCGGPAPSAIRAAVARARGAVDSVDERLLSIPTGEYVHRLTSRTASRAGKVSCPFHEPDRTPSLHCYEDGTFYCYGCGAGGSIYDFAAYLWSAGEARAGKGGRELRGHEFLRLRDRLAELFLEAVYQV
jgi:hypothetical protein